MRTWEQSKRRLSNEKLPGHDSYDDKTALQGWSFSTGEFSNNACTPYLWACDIHVIFLWKNSQGQIWSNWSMFMQVKCRYRLNPHRRFETTHPSDIAVLVWLLHGNYWRICLTFSQGSSCVKGHHPKKKEKKKKNIHNIYSSCLPQWSSSILTTNLRFFLVPFYTIDRYLCEKFTSIDNPPVFVHHQKNGETSWWDHMSWFKQGSFWARILQRWEATSNLPRTRLAVQHHPDIEGFHQIHNQRVLKAKPHGRSCHFCFLVCGV